MSLLLKLGLLCVCVGFCLLFLVLIVWGVMWLRIVSFFFGRSLTQGNGALGLPRMRSRAILVQLPDSLYCTVELGSIDGKF